MAKYARVTTWQVRQVWAASDLKPHRLKTFKISNDPHFADKVVDVVGLYLSPPDNAMVLSVDEKTQIQALDRTQPMLPLRPGQVERRTHDYKRHGTASLYAAFDIMTGQVIGRITQRHRAKEFLDFLQQIERSTPAGLDLHVILDNSSTHKTAAIKQWLEKHPPFKLHFTPISASWLNAVEGWFAQLERRALYWGTFTSVADLKAAIRQFIEAHNEHHGLAAVDILDQIEVVKLSANRRWKVGDIPRPNLICRGRGISGWRLMAVRPLCSGAVMLLTRRMTFERGRYAGGFCSDHVANRSCWNRSVDCSEKSKSSPKH